MSQDGRKDEATRRQTDDGLGLLQVVLLSYDDKGERQKDGDKYAAIKFPQSYEDAMSSIQQNLGRYLKGRLEMIDSVYILCPMLNIDDEWIWAEADKKDWDRIIQELKLTRKILAIRQRNVLQIEAESDRIFYKGSVILTYGERIGGSTKWSDAEETLNSKVPYIDRPASFKAAIELITEAKNSDPYASAYGGIRKNKDLNLVEFKFYYFVTERGGVPSTDTWEEFPPEAYSNDKIWRTVVPKSRQILGYSVHPKV